VRGSATRFVGAVVLWAATMVGAQAARAADLPGALDFPLLQRMAGSEIVGYGRRFGTYRLQTSTYEAMELVTRQAQYVRPPLLLEGDITRIWYAASAERSAEQVFRGYQQELAARGFTILYDSSRDPAAGNWPVFHYTVVDDAVRTSVSPDVWAAYSTFNSPRDIFTCSARLARPGGDVYVRVVAIAWSKDEPSHHVKRAVYAAVDIIEASSVSGARGLDGPQFSHRSREWAAR
jgi:OmpA-OmpF porin, OOP family